MTRELHLTMYIVNFDSNSYSLLRKYQFRLSTMFRSTTGSESKWYEAHQYYFRP